jgi:hypothetical protein
VVERVIGNDEVESSILSRGTSLRCAQRGEGCLAEAQRAKAGALIARSFG